jgi:hypothetical protein
MCASPPLRQLRNPFRVLRISRKHPFRGGGETLRGAQPKIHWETGGIVPFRHTRAAVWSVLAARMAASSGGAPSVVLLRRRVHVHGVHGTPRLAAAGLAAGLAPRPILRFPLREFSRYLGIRSPLAFGSYIATGHPSLHMKASPSRCSRCAKCRASSLPLAPRSQHVRRAPHATATSVEHVRIDHRRPHVGMAEQLLLGTNVVAILQEVCRE